MFVSAIRQESTGKKAEEKNAALPLVPLSLLLPLWCISLAMPNLVYSGVSWYDTLHLVKWAVAGIPVGIAILVGGARLALYGHKRIHFKVDLFGVVWMGLLAYTMMQAGWVDISSRTGFVHELLCFAAIWGFYVISWNAFPDHLIRPILWLANINAAINVFFAELQIRNLNGFTKLILPTPGNYIGNTGQQNMFGLWMAVCVMSSIYLYIAYATTLSGKKRHPAVTGLNLVLLLVNMWGLLNSTSRSAMLSLAAALCVLVSITLCQFGRDYAKRLLHVLALFAFVFLLLLATNKDRATEMIVKILDMVNHVESIGGRSGIWATSATMFKMHPVSGVGIGQYKWHYLEAQKEMLKSHPDKPWQYTHWAHNEFLQWFCEGGVAGGLLLLSMWGIWGWYFVKMLWRRENVAREVIWACSLIALITFNALWTRPFHRIENILWLSLAFALANRDMISVLAPKKAFPLGGLARVCGAVLCAASLSGMYYLVDGMVGDRELREALSTPNPVVQRNLLQKAFGHFMVMEDAYKNLGYHYMRIGEYENDLNNLDKGTEILWQHFQREPHSEEMGFLLNWAQSLQKVPMLEALAGYLKPGTYRLEKRDVTDGSGRVVNATILVPLKNSGGMVVVPPPEEKSNVDDN